MQTPQPDDQKMINRRQCVCALTAVGFVGIVPQSVAAGPVSSSMSAPALGNLLAIPAPSDAALFLQAYLTDDAL